MRGLFWVLALFATAVGLSLAARYNDGYVLFFINPQRIELSLTLFVLLLVLAFAVFYFFIRAASYTLGLPQRVRAFRARRVSEKARHAMFDAVVSSFEGRYARAAKSAASAYAAGEESGLAALVAARAEHGMEHFEVRDEWLQRAAEAATKSADASLQHARLMTQAELLADQHRDTEALAALSELNQSGARHIATQRLSLRSLTRAGRWDDALKVAHRLEEHQAVHPAVAAKTRELAYQALFANGDAADLRERLRNLPRADRRQAAVARSIATGLIRAGLMTDAAELIETALDHEWDSDLAALYADCDFSGAVLDEQGGVLNTASHTASHTASTNSSTTASQTQAAHQLERAERWLSSHPRDAALLLGLGRLCARQQLWGKARSFLEQSAVVTPGRAVWLELARLSNATGQVDAANRYYRQAAEAEV